jgi:putative acyl-CoA dehydrogenase
MAKVLAGPDAEGAARAAVERLAVLATATAVQASAPDVAEAYARTRLVRGGATYGTADLTSAEVNRLLERALPAA